MARIAGVDLPREKRVEIGLTYVFGIGRKTSNEKMCIRDRCWITSNQIEAARIAMTRYTKRGGQVWIKIFPDKPVTEKPAETRMGSGKGSPEYWVCLLYTSSPSCARYTSTRIPASSSSAAPTSA